MKDTVYEDMKAIALLHLHKAVAKVERLTAVVERIEEMKASSTNGKTLRTDIANVVEELNAGGGNSDNLRPRFVPTPTVRNRTTGQFDPPHSVRIRQYLESEGPSTRKTVAVALAQEGRPESSIHSTICSMVQTGKLNQFKGLVSVPGATDNNDHSVDKTPKGGVSCRNRILEYLRGFGPKPRGAVYAELSDAGYGRGSVAPRLTELIRRGVIIDRNGELTLKEK